MNNTQSWEGKKKQQQPAADQQVLVDALAKALVQAAGTQPEQGAAKRQEPKTIDLIELFYMILSKIHYVIIAALVGAIFMGVQAARSTPMYSATSKLYIVGNQGASINLTFGGNVCHMFDAEGRNLEF